MNKPSPSIDLVTFDLDNTLWDVTQTIMAAEKLLHSWMADHTPAALPAAHVRAIRFAVLRFGYPNIPYS